MTKYFSECLFLFFFHFSSAPVTWLGFDLSNRYLLTAGDKHIHVIHNVAGYKATIIDLKEKEKKATSQAMKERIRQQIEEARYECIKQQEEEMQDYDAKLVVFQ